MTTTTRATIALRNLRALLRKLDEEHAALTLQALQGNTHARIAANELGRIIQRIEAAIRV